MKKYQDGFSVVEELLLVVIVGMLGGVGWYVWHSQQQADKTYTLTANSSVEPKAKKQSKEVSATTPSPAASVAQLSNIKYSDAPKELRVEIGAHDDSSHPSCMNSGRGESQPIDVYEKAVNPDIVLVTKADSGFATYANNGCEGPKELYVKVGGQWQFIAETKYGFSCDTLKKYGVPDSVLGSPAQCSNADGSLVAYTHTLN